MAKNGDTSSGKFTSMFHQVDDEQCCTSKLKFSNYQLNWTIEDFEFVCRNVKVIESPRFPSENLQAGQWFIQLEPTDLCETNNEEFKIRLKKADDIKKYVNVEITFFSSCNAELTLVSTPTSSLIGTSLKQAREILWATPASEFHKELRKIPKDILVTCRLSVFESGTSLIEKPLADDSSKSDDLLENIESFYKDKDFKDVTFTIGKRKFTAHKSILALRSPLFASLFKSKKPEELTSVVKLTDITPTVFEKVLRFIYTDKVDKLSEYSMLLYPAAKKYQLKRLQSMCINSLLKNLGPTTVVEYLTFAETHSLLNLKKKCLKHLNSDLAAIKDTKEFIILKQRFPHLIDEINNMPSTIETEEQKDDQSIQELSLKFRS